MSKATWNKHIKVQQGRHSGTSLSSQLLRRLRQEDYKFKVRLCSLVRPYLKIKF
jgi:hypothetical protein